MPDKEQEASTIRSRGRDDEGRFTKGNQLSRGHSRCRVSVNVPLPPELRSHSGTAAIWPLLSALAMRGNCRALKLLHDIATGTTKVKPLGCGPTEVKFLPADLGLDEFGEDEEDDEDDEDDDEDGPYA